MWNMYDVTAIEFREAYIYWIQFDNGVSGNVDLYPYFKGEVFEPLKEVGFFRQAVIEGGTIAWPNGADIAPETLYEQLERQVSMIAEKPPEYKTGND